MTIEARIQAHFARPLWTVIADELTDAEHVADVPFPDIVEVYGSSRVRFDEIVPAVSGERGAASGRRT
jgi:hypothetical protein